MVPSSENTCSRNLTPHIYPNFKTKFCRHSKRHILQEGPSVLSTSSTLRLGFFSRLRTASSTAGTDSLESLHSSFVSAPVLSRSFHLPLPFAPLSLLRHSFNIFFPSPFYPSQPFHIFFKYLSTRQFASNICPLKISPRALFTHHVSLSYPFLSKFITASLLHTLIHFRLQGPDEKILGD